MADYHPMRLRLLELHKSLLDAERIKYERLHGRVTPHAFLQALTSDPSLAWLAPLNVAIVRLDELLDLHEQNSEDTSALSEHIAALRELLSLDGADPSAFAQRYAELVQAAPEVAFAHAALAPLLS